MNCRCRTQVEKLRTIMEQTYDEYLSFTDPAVLSASQALDDALVQYRNCPSFEQCSRWGRPDTQSKKDPTIC
ncbi:aspartyl-phosphate phosphatase Spo0E family protein [Paenibacillus sp. PL2-23]|uniref:aspartyl-phosphate phosphatase Spo0E family protein n=1 Tax=Paenibacillus sp. PL2-23 TaxID=2100729 RepID=UPI0030F53895